MHAVEVERVSKTFRIPHERQTRLVERATALFRPSPVELLPALSDVSLAVPKGGFMGVVGANGSGKSTLLKVIAGILVPDAGAVRVHGSLAPLLELGLGFHPELSARDNVTLYGAVLGYPPDRMAERVAAALAFAELERFADAKLKSFSSGMAARLAFATAVLADADILLLDEVLAVGDAGFQEKCAGAFTEFRRQGKTVVLVSHDLGAVQRCCDTAAWIDRGRLVTVGPAADVVQSYVTAIRSHPTRPGEATGHVEDRAGRFGAQEVRYVRGALEDQGGRPLTQVRTGQRVVLRLHVEYRVPSRDAVFGFGVRQLGPKGGHTLYSINNQLLGLTIGEFQPGDALDIRIPFTAMLVNGDYSITVAIAERRGEVDGWMYHDWITDFLTFSVDGSRCQEGQADLHAEFHCDAVRSATAPRIVTAGG